MRKLINLLLFVCYSNLLYSQDTPCSATPLVVNSGLCGVYTLGTTVGASYQNDAANGGTPTCASPGSPDVWYSFVAPATGLITITTSAGTITDSGIQIYSSSNNLCTGTLTALNCDDDGGPGLMSELNLCGLTPGNTYWVRVWKYNPGTGTFNICIYTPVSAPINAQNCSGATQVCSNSPFSGNSSGFSTQELNACNQGCLTVEHQSSWYVIQIQTSGTLNMTIAPGVGVDYDYALWVKIFQNTIFKKYIQLISPNILCQVVHQVDHQLGVPSLLDLQQIFKQDHIILELVLLVQNHLMVQEVHLMDGRVH